MMTTFRTSVTKARWVEIELSIFILIVMGSTSVFGFNYLTTNALLVHIYPKEDNHPSHPRYLLILLPSTMIRRRHMVFEGFLDLLTNHHNVTLVFFGLARLRPFIVRD